MSRLLTRKPAYVLSLLLCLVMPLSSCSSSKSSSKNVATATPADERYRHATELISRKKYDDAIAVLESLMFSTRATNLEDKVLHSLADTYFKTKQYLLSADIYRRLLQQTPDSPFAKDAQFQLGRSYEKLSPFYELDQEYTVKAIEEFNTYLDQYPEDNSADVSSEAEMYRELLKVNPSNTGYREKYDAAMAKLSGDSPVRYCKTAIPVLREKLAHNRFSIATQYFKLKKYKAAEIFYDVIINQYSDTKWIEQAWAGKIEMNIKRGKWFEARQSVERFQQLYPEKSKHVDALARKVTEHFSSTRNQRSK
jgi:outer membrane protein assembly factor BamD